MSNYKSRQLDTKQIIGLIIMTVLIFGLGVGVYLVQRQQTIKSQATTENFVEAFEIKDKNGSLIQCDSRTNPPTCTTRTLDINVRLKDPTLLLP